MIASLLQMMLEQERLQDLVTFLSTAEIERLHAISFVLLSTATLIFSIKHRG